MVFDCKNVNCGVAIFYRRQEQDCCSHTSTFRFLEGICLRADAFRKAVMVGLEKKLTLYGFNNLTKTLSFNIFDVCYAKSEREKQDYIRYIDEQYNSERLTNILCDVTEMIGAAVLNISRQAYSNYENGTRLPDLETACVIADYFQISLDQLVRVGLHPEKPADPFASLPKDMQDFLSDYHCLPDEKQKRVQSYTQFLRDR